MGRKYLALPGLLLWTAMIFTLSSQSQPPGQGTGGGLLWGHSDLLVHAAIYLVLGFLLATALRVHVSGGRVGLRYLWVVAGVVVAGGVDELYQGTVSGRTTSLLDLSADAVGGLGAVLTALVLARYGYRLRLKGKGPRDKILVDG